MTLYFDPARRASVSQAPALARAPLNGAEAPAGLKAPGYFDPTKPRPVPTRFPTEAEIVAAFEALHPAARRTLEQVVALPEEYRAPGTPKHETPLDYFRRRVEWQYKCEGCGAVSRGDWGHRRHCPEYREMMLPRWLRRRKPEPEPDDAGDPDDDLPF